MNNCDINEVLEKLFIKKLELGGKALDLLPSSVRPAVKELQTQTLTLLRDGLDRYLKNDGHVKDEPSLRKIELE